MTIELKVAEKAFYHTGTGEKIPVIIIAINNELDRCERYTVRVRTKRSRTYRIGEEFTTSINWLSKT